MTRTMDIYRALADPTRRAILDELVEREGQSLFEICGRLTMKHGIHSTRQAVSQHLEALEGAGLIRTAREGRSKLHWFVGDPLRAIAERWPIRREGRRTGAAATRRARRSTPRKKIRPAKRSDR